MNGTMIKHWKLLLSCVGALTLGLVGTSLVYGGVGGNPPTATNPASDRTPVAGGRSLAARTQTKRGLMAVLLYRNKSGQQCMSAGRPNGDTVGIGSGQTFKELPLSKLGACNLSPNPVAVEILHSREETTIYGLAADNVTKLAVTSNAGTLQTRPASDHAFIVTVPRSLSGPVSVTTTSQDGSSQSVKVADLPNLDDLTAMARRNEPPPVAAPTDPAP
jgi:hypothetical protein